MAEPSSDKPDLDQSIAENAAGPKRAQGDSGSVEQHALKDQVEVDRYLASKEAAKRRDRGLRMNRIAPPGAGETACWASSSRAARRATRAGSPRARAD